MLFILSEIIAEVRIFYISQVIKCMRMGYLGSLGFIFSSVALTGHDLVSRFITSGKEETEKHQRYVE